jgi:RNA polymerase sigma factor (sigma-70 family)
MRAYLNEPMGELARQLSMGQLRLRQGYIDAAEELLSLIVAEEEYPYEFVVFKLTGYRPGERSKPYKPFSEKSLREDLQTLILDLCDSFDYGVALYNETVYDTESLAKKYQVSTKTIQRWRRQGLVARRMIFPNAKRRVAFLQRSVDAFTGKRERQVERSKKFSQLTEQERADILRRAKRMAGWCNCHLHDVARRIAAKTGRAVETIRYTIRKHDKANPTEAIFPKLTDPLDEVTKQVVYRSFLRGVTVPVLADQYKRTRSSVYRVINEMRARHVVAVEIDCVYNNTFDLPDADGLFLAEPPPEDKKPSRTIRPPKDLPPYLASLYEVPLLGAKEEPHLFRKYNYLKYKADALRKKIDVERPRMGQVSRVESLLAQSNAVKNKIIRSNLRLVVSIARKHLAGGSQNLFELISDGNISLMRAVEKFDYARGFKFSTYASWAIMKNFARSVPRERYRQGKFLTGQEEALDVAAGLAGYDPNEDSLSEVRESIDVVLSQLTARERSILRA